MTVVFWYDSGKQKAHKHKENFPVTARVGGVSWPGFFTGGQGSKVHVLCAEPRNINIFVRVPGREESGSRPGGSVTGVTEKLFMCQMFMCLFRPRMKGSLGNARHGVSGRGCDDEAEIRKERCLFSEWMPCLATRATIDRSLRRSFGGSAAKSKTKYPKKSKNTNFRTFLGIFRLLRVFFGTFLQTPQKTIFETFLRFRARRARRLL